jgi:hypothetical protein
LLLEKVPKRSLALSSTSYALRIATLPVAISEIRAKAVFCSANRVWDFKAVKLSTLLRHVFVSAVHNFTALSVLFAKIDALLSNLFAALDISIEARVASSKAFLREAIEVLLIVLVLVHERRLNALHKHVFDGLQSSLDVVIKFPPRFADRLISNLLHEGLHCGDIAVPHGIHEIHCFG